jgi:DNA polymerase-1
MTWTCTATAAEVFGVALEEVTTDQRRSAKAINFGLIYGMSAFGLAKQIGVDRKQSQDYIDRYFARYPGVLASGAHPRPGGRAGLRRNPVRPPPVPAGHQRQNQALRKAPNARRSTRRCRAPPPTSSSAPWWQWITG